MPITVTPRAVAILRRALDAGRMDASSAAVRVRVVRGLRGEEVHTGFADEPAADEVVVDAGGVRLYVSASLAERGAVVDASEEHERIVVRPAEGA